jgi:hypothetical protein
LNLEYIYFGEISPIKKSLPSCQSVTVLNYKMGICPFVDQWSFKKKKRLDFHNLENEFIRNGCMATQWLMNGSYLIIK